MSTFPAKSTIPIPFELDDAAGDPVTGATAVCYIQRQADGKWWNGSAWVVTPQALSMTEDSSLSGHYVYEFDHDAAEDASEDHELYNGRCRIATGLTKGGIAFVFGTSKAFDDAITARKVATNRTELLAGAVGNFIVYDDDDTPLLTHDVTDGDDAAISQQPGAPFKRSKGS